MIRTLVVDDDFMAASVHREFTERVPGFEVVGEATTGADALRLIGELQPDLVLLDVYLPDLSGIDVLRRLRATAQAHVDVIAITSAKDVHVLREAMHLGVVHYIVKPFTFTTLSERLETYASLKSQLDHLQQADQPDIDRLYRILRTRNVHESLPKGISAPTLAHVVDILRSAGRRALVGGACNPRQPQPRDRPPLPPVPGRLGNGESHPPLRARRPPGAHLPLGGARATGPGLAGVTSHHDATMSEPTSTPASMSSAISSRL